MQTERRTFSTVFIILIVMLVVLPFLTTFQDILTRIVMRFDLYRYLQDFIVPYEIRVVSSILGLMHIPIQAGHAYIQFIRNGKTEAIYIIWNCVGWQSLIIFLLTLVTGFSGNHTWLSKLEAFLIGVLGTYLINIFRLVLVILMYYFTGRGIGVVFHDYFSGLLSIAWIFFFWYIAYSMVLEERVVRLKGEGPRVKGRVKREVK